MSPRIQISHAESTKRISYVLYGPESANLTHYLVCNCCPSTAALPSLKACSRTKVLTYTKKQKEDSLLDTELLFCAYEAESDRSGKQQPK